MAAKELITNNDGRLSTTATIQFRVCRLFICDAFCRGDG